jgi:hypothetical protein
LQATVQNFYVISIDFVAVELKGDEQPRARGLTTETPPTKKPRKKIYELSMT